MGLFFLAIFGIIVFLFSAWVKRIRKNEREDKLEKKTEATIQIHRKEQVDSSKDLQQIPKSSEDSKDIGSSRK
jgi:hypothetical protein